MFKKLPVLVLAGILALAVPASVFAQRGGGNRGGGGGNRGSAGSARSFSGGGSRSFNNGGGGNRSFSSRSAPGRSVVRGGGNVYRGGNYYNYNRGGRVY